jgi:hypothetical protein
MSNVVSLTNKRDWKWHRDRIAAAWGKQVESIIETGRVLLGAKEELEHGSFLAMVKLELPFGRHVAQRVMKIAQNPILSKGDHGRLLPPSYQTLYELTKLPNDILVAKLKDGSIHPKLERKDVRAMRPDVKDKPERATREELIAAIQRDPLANQRDAAAELGVSLGQYQRTRNELIGSGQIKGDVSPITTIEPQAQRDEMRRSYVTFLVALAKEDQVEEITKIIRRELGWTTKEISLFLSSNYPRTKFKI